MNEQAIEIISTIGPTCVLIAFLSIIIVTTRQRKNTATYPQLQANLDIATVSQTAKSTTMAVVTKCNKKTIPDIIEVIDQTAKKRKSEINLNANSWDITPEEGKYLQDLFKSFGYKTEFTPNGRYSGKLTLKWDKETTSMLKSRIPPLCRCKSCDRCHHEPETPCPKCGTNDQRVCWL